MAVVVLATASACATADLDVVSPVPIALKRVTLQIHDGTGGDMSPEQIASLESFVAAGLRDSGIAVVPQESNPDTARVTGRVTEYAPGIRALRFINKYGFGTGSLATVWEADDLRSGQRARCKIEGSVSMGTFGGSFDDVQEEVGRALARFLRGGIW